MVNIVLIITVMVFAFSMGGSGIASAFSASYGSKTIKKGIAVVLFTVFVFLGAFFIGGNVIKTISSNIIPKELFSPTVALVVIFSAALTLTLANFLKIPGSTSMVTVGALIGAGAYFSNIYLRTLFFMFLVWVVLSAVSYFLTYFLYKITYPPTNKNLWIYEKFFEKEKSMKIFILVTSCYSAFAIGTNNVANAIGPLAGAGTISPFLGLLVVTPFFGLGGLIFGKSTIETFGNDIVPLGTISAPLILLVTNTLLIIASVLGCPFPYVLLTCFSTLAVSSVKNGHIHTMNNKVVKKIFKVWTITPLISTGMTLLLLSIFLRGQR